MVDSYHFSPLFSKSLRGPWTHPSFSFHLYIFIPICHSILQTLGDRRLPISSAFTLQACLGLRRESSHTPIVESSQEHRILQPSCILLLVIILDDGRFINKQLHFELGHSTKTIISGFRPNIRIQKEQ